MSGHTYTYIHTHRTTTVILAAHARRGLIIIVTINFVQSIMLFCYSETYDRAIYIFSQTFSSSPLRVQETMCENNNLFIDEWMSGNSIYITSFMI